MPLAFIFQSGKAEKNPVAAIRAKRYTFHALWITPMAGAIRQLTDEYDLQVTPDSVISYLPYFGRAYQAPYPGADGGIKFTSTRFLYQCTAGKKNGWEILIKPKDADDIASMFLTVSTSGNAELQVTCVNRQPVTFSGEILQQDAH